MRTGLSNPICRAARSVPFLSKTALKVCAKAIAPHKPPWLVSRIAGDLNVRIPVDTHLKNGMPIRVVWTDIIGYSICVDGYYDVSSVQVLQSILKPGGIFVDVGTHVGQYTLVAAGQIGPSGAVHSFEPQPDTFSLLQFNVRRNGLQNVRLNRCALADRCDDVNLYVAQPDNVGQSSLRRPHNYTGIALKVPCRTLDDYAEEQGLRQVDVIKIDVEGAELSVLKGARKVLSGKTKPTLIVEFWDEFQREYGASCDEMAAFLRDRGYQLFSIDESGPIPYSAQSKLFNVLAVHSGS